MHLVYRFAQICPYCGRFPLEIYNRLMLTRELTDKFPDKAARRDYILKNMIYVNSLNYECALIAMRMLYGNIITQGNVRCLDRKIYTYVGREADYCKALNFKNENGEIIMRFDCVIGNPPYNNDMYLEFVTLGHKLAKQYDVWITPAKWQTKQGKENKVFRRDIVPYMREIVYYPDCIDIFDIRIYGGISYFLLDKNTCEDKVIKNVNASHKEFNSVESRKLDAPGILNNLGTEINELLSSYKKVKTFNNNGRYQVWITDTYDSSSNGSCMFRSDGKTGVLCPTRIIDSKNSKNTVGTAKLLFASDIKAECESFVSWLWCKFIRFMILIAVDGFHIGANMHYYRFVPAPPIQQTDLTANPWDHIYTDKELYDYFKIPQKYIDVIESVIKERKKLE